LNLISVADYFENKTKGKNYIYALKYAAEVCEKQGDIENAVNYCKKAVENAEEFGSSDILADCYSLFGDIYLRITDFDSALKYLQKALDIREKNDNKHAIASSYNLIARTHRVSGSYDNAFTFYQKALQCREKIEDNEGLLWTHIGLANTYTDIGDYSLAEENYLASLELNKKFEDKRCNLYCFHGLGKLKSLAKEYCQAEKFLLKALEIANETSSKLYLFEIHYSLSELYEKINDNHKALIHFKLFHKNREEVLNSEIQNRLKNQSLNFEIEKTKKESEIFQLKNIELKKAYEELANKNNQITDSIKYAQKIQFAIIQPINHLKNDLLDYFILFMPRDIVSGDFYWLNKIENKIYIVVADCTGHGVPGAFMSILGISFLNEIVKIKKIKQSDEILNKLRSNIKVALRQEVTNTYDGMDISLCIIDVNTNFLQYSGAFNPLLLIRNDEINLFKGDRMPIGRYIIDDVPFTKQEIKIQKNDKFYIFSDGYTDQFGGKKFEKFKLVNFKNLINQMHKKPFKEQKSILKTSFKKWKGNNLQFDDVLVIGFEAKIDIT